VIVVLGAALTWVTLIVTERRLGWGPEAGDVPGGGTHGPSMCAGRGPADRPCSAVFAACTRRSRARPCRPDHAVDPPAAVLL